MKKTALDDDAAIYQRKRNKTERQKWHEMDAEQRRQYFVDYYLGKFAAGLTFIFIFIFLLWHFLKPDCEVILYVAVIDESLNEEKAGQMTEELNHILGADGKKRRIILDDSFYMKDGALEKLEVYLHSGQVDVIIADEKVWSDFAGYGFLKDIKDVDKSGRYEAQRCFAAGYRDSDEISFEDDETGKGEERAYGIDISESRCFAEMSEYIEHPVFAVAEGCQNQEQVLKFLEVLMRN